MSQFRVIKPFHIAAGIAVAAGEVLPLSFEQAVLHREFIEEVRPEEQEEDAAPTAGAASAAEADTNSATADGASAPPTESKPAAGKNGNKNGNKNQ